MAFPVNNDHLGACNVSKLRFNPQASEFVPSSQQRVNVSPQQDEGPVLKLQLSIEPRLHKARNVIHESQYRHEVSLAVQQMSSTSFAQAWGNDEGPIPEFQLPVEPRVQEAGILIQESQYRHAVPLPVERMTSTGFVHALPNEESTPRFLPHIEVPLPVETVSSTRVVKAWANDIAAYSPVREGLSQSVKSTEHYLPPLSSKAQSEKSYVSITKTDSRADETRQAQEKIDEILSKHESRTIAMRDLMIREYLKVLKKVPHDIEETADMFANTFNDITTFTNIAIKGEGLQHDLDEAMKRIQKAVVKHKALAKSLSQLRLGTQARMWKEGLGYLLFDVENQQETDLEKASGEEERE
ncbi:hypothetical protein MMC13_002632 [Lambiella insularis]|nr:hypothetical protein [Lambiella insularis]